MELNENLDGPYPNSILKTDDTPLNNVKFFRYLRVWSDYDDIHIGETEWKYVHLLKIERC